MAGGHPTHFAGDLRQVLLDAAIADIDERGIGALSLRSIARRVGVSHAAAAYHFGERAGLLTSLAGHGADRRLGARRGQSSGRVSPRLIRSVRRLCSRHLRFEVLSVSRSAASSR
jgi:AcrR family transcriptional regulator